MTAHTHRTVVPGCYRCDLNKDEIGISDSETTYEIFINGSNDYRATGDAELSDRLAEIGRDIWRWSVDVGPEYFLIDVVASE